MNANEFDTLRNNLSKLTGGKTVPVHTIATLPIGLQRQRALEGKLIIDKPYTYQPTPSDKPIKVWYNGAWGMSQEEEDILEEAGELPEYNDPNAEIWQKKYSFTTGKGPHVSLTYDDLFIQIKELSV